MATKHGNWVAGEATPPGIGDYLKSTCPRTGEVAALIPRGTAADVDRAVRAAEQAQPGWATLRPAGRGWVLQEIARAIRARRDEFSALEWARTGKHSPGPEADGAAANGVPHGLAASVWNRDMGRALRLADRPDAGQVSVNGIGRVKGVEALRTCTQLKAISIKTS